MVMTFSSMPVARAAALAVAVEMLTKSKHDFALMYIGKTQKDPVPASTQAAVDELKEKGKLLEAERADFGVLFKEMDAFIVHGGLVRPTTLSHEERPGQFELHCLARKRQLSMLSAPPLRPLPCACVYC